MCISYNSLQDGSHGQLYIAYASQEQKKIQKRGVYLAPKVAEGSRETTYKKMTHFS